MAKIRTMTEGHPLKLIFAFSLPLMFGNVFQQFYTVVDTMVVGQALGVGALAALGAADWLNWMVLGMIQGISQGFAILMAYEFGAGDYRKLRQVIANSAILACLGSVVMLALMQAAARPVLLLLNTPDEIIGRSLLYLRIMFWGIPIVMAYNVLASFGPWETGKHRSTLWWWPPQSTSAWTCCLYSSFTGGSAVRPRPR